MNTCDTCLYWEPGEGWYCPTAFGYCAYHRHAWRRGNAEAPLDGVLKPADGPQSMGDTGEPASLKTGPKYGCVHHAPIDTTRKTS